MLESISRFSIALLELIETELQAARKGSLRLVIAIGLAWAGITLLLGALGLLIWALFVMLAASMPASGAAALCALIVLVLAGGLLWLAIRQVR